MRLHNPIMYVIIGSLEEPRVSIGTHKEDHENGRGCEGNGQKFVELIKVTVAVCCES